MASDNPVNVTINDESLRRSLRALDLAATDRTRDAQNRRNPAGGNAV